MELFVNDFDIEVLKDFVDIAEVVKDPLYEIKGPDLPVLDFSWTFPSKFWRESLLSALSKCSRILTEPENKTLELRISNLIKIFSPVDP